jgi:septum formation protein
VVSGAALIGDGVDERLADVAVVTWGQVSADTIDTYVASGEWAGKAGGYNLAERVAAGWPITVEGDPATVMGVPMRKLLPVLRELL